MSLSSTLAKLLHQLNLSILVHTSTQSISVLLSPCRESGAASGTATWAAWQTRILPSGTGCQHLDHRITNDRAVPRITTISFCTSEDGGHGMLVSAVFWKVTSWNGFWMESLIFLFSFSFRLCLFLFLQCLVQMLPNYYFLYGSYLKWQIINWVATFLIHLYKRMQSILYWDVRYW